MAFVLPDRTRETLASAPGTGNATTAGATQGAQSIASSLTSNGDTTWATLDNGTAWETNTITRVSAGVYSRGTPFASSNAGALVNFSSGTLEIFPDLPGIKAKVLERLAWSAAAVTPPTNDGTALGTVALSFSDLFLATGGVINFANSDVTIAHSAGSLSIAAAVGITSTLGVTGNLAINTNKFNVTAASGNTTIAGTLGVTGDVAVNTNKFNVTAASGNTAIAGTLAVTLGTTLSAALTYGGVTLSNAVTGTGNMVLSASPTFTGTITSGAINASATSSVNGSLYVGTTSAAHGGKLEVKYDGGANNGLIWDDTATGSASKFAVLIYRNTVNVGSITETDVAVAYNTSSDGRMKTDRRPIENPRAIIMAVEPCNFAWRHAPDRRSDGFIAQDVHRAIPLLGVHVGDDSASLQMGDPGFEAWGLDQGKFTPYLWAAQRDIYRELDEIKRQITRRTAA